LKVAELSENDLCDRLVAGGLSIRIGCFDVSVSSPLPIVAKGIKALYRDFTLSNENDITDFNIELKAPSPLRHVIRPQVNFYYDGRNPFKPLPQDQGFAMFEWGLNWCIANTAHQFLNIHSAVVEVNSMGFIFPGAPGSGKSTLCAALVHNGCRLLSDEMALISVNGGNIFPIPRPVGLKNRSINIIQALSPGIFISDIVPDTAKGTVAHMRPPRSSVEAGSSALPKFIIFPKYRAETETRLAPISKGKAFLKVAENSFNYNVLGRLGFEVLARLIDQSACFTITYSSLTEAIDQINELANVH